MYKPWPLNFCFLVVNVDLKCILWLFFFFFNLMTCIFKEAMQGLKVQPVGIKAVFVIILNSSLGLST